MDEQPKEQTEPEGVKVSDLVKKFSASEKTMKSEFLPKYQLAKERLRAEHDVKGKGTRKLTHEQVNLVLSIGQNFVNSVYNKSPRCNLTARENENYDRVENTEIAVNDWLKDKKCKKVIKKAIWDAYLGGFGAVFLDYEYDDMDDTSRPVMREGLAEDGITPIQVPEVNEQNQPLFERIVLKNEITIQRIRPDLLRFPEGFDFDNFQDSPWLGFDLIKPIDEVKNNENWDAYVREKIEGERYSKLSQSDKSKSSKSDEGSELYAKISYTFTKPANPTVEPFKLTVFHSQCTDKPLQEIEFKKGHRGYPIKPIFFNPTDDDCPYPNGDVWNMESQLNAVDEWWKKIVRHVKRSNPKVAYDSGAITPQEAQKLASNNDNELVGLSNKERRDIRTMLMDLNAPVQNPDLHKLWEVARELLSEIAPKSALSRGAEDNPADTATEAKIMQAGELVDLDARIDDVSDFLKDIVMDVAGILSESLVAPLSIEKEIELEGMKKTVFQDVDAEGFTSKVLIDIDVESMQAQNKDVLRKQLIQMMELLGQLQTIINAAGKQPDPVWWFQRLLETCNIRNIDKAFVDIAPMAPMPVPTQAGEITSPEPTGVMPPQEMVPM